MPMGFRGQVAYLCFVACRLFGLAGWRRLRPYNRYENKAMRDLPCPARNCTKIGLPLEAPHQNHGTCSSPHRV